MDYSLDKISQIIGQHNGQELSICLCPHSFACDCDGKKHGDLPAGRGVTPIRDYLKAIVDTGYSGTVSIELEYAPDPDRIVEWVEEAYQSTAAMMDQVGLRG